MARLLQQEEKQEVVEEGIEARVEELVEALKYGSNEDHMQISLYECGRSDVAAQSQVNEIS